MLIVNRTDLSYQYLGWIIDKLMETIQGNTIYYGKIDYTSIIIKNKREIQIEIHYLKSYTKFIFWERGKNGK